MKHISLGGTSWMVPAVAVGCMRLGELDSAALGRFIHAALDHGANFFDHADIYGGGACEEHFGAALQSDPSAGRT